MSHLPNHQPSAGPSTGQAVSIDDIVSLGSSDELYSTLVAMIEHMEPDDIYRGLLEQLRRVCERPDSEEARAYMSRAEDIAATTRQMLADTEPLSEVMLNDSPTNDGEAPSASMGSEPSAGASAPESKPQSKYISLSDLHRLFERYEQHCLTPRTRSNLQATGPRIVPAHLQANRTFLLEIDSMAIWCPQPRCRESYASAQSGLRWHLASPNGHNLDKAAVANAIRPLVSPECTPWKCRWVTATGYRCPVGLTDRRKLIFHVQVHIMREMVPVKEGDERCERCSFVVRRSYEMAKHRQTGACKAMVKLN